MPIFLTVLGTLFALSVKIFNTPEIPTAKFINLKGSHPVIYSKKRIHFTVSGLPPPWHVFLVVGVGSNHLYPEVEVAPSLRNNGSYSAHWVTIGEPNGTLYIVTTDRYASLAFSSYIKEQKLRQKDHKNWVYISKKWNINL